MTQVPMRTRGPYEWAVMVYACIIAAVSVGLGASLILADPLRTSSASFDTIKAIAPIRLWGMVYVVSGLAALLCQWMQVFQVVLVAHLVAAGMYFAWFLCFWYGLDNPRASLNGVFIYLGLSLLHGTTAIVARRS